ncbi:MAG: hypothetical protein K9M75_01730 [Phycisphaerae bacterium]|nr:hypothetical protein [Phycisphaerae bacterium]
MLRVKKFYDKKLKYVDKRQVVLIFICLMITLMSGCDSANRSITAASKKFGKPNISIGELQVQLDAFEEVFTNRTKSAASEIDNLSNDPKTRKMTLLWRSRAIAALHNIREQSQPKIVMVDSWLLCIRLSNFMESGEASNAFGEHQPIALGAVKELEAQIEEIGRNVLPEGLFNDTSNMLKSMARGKPIQSGFGKTLMYSKQTKIEEPGIFQSIINIPLSPVRALEGVDHTSEAIYDFSNTTQRMTDVVQELPESARWQLLLLLYDIEETNMANSFLKSLQNISESSSKLSGTADQLTAILKKTSQNEGKINETLKQVNQTSANLESLFSSAQETSKVFLQTANQVDEAILNWTEAAKVTKEVIEQINSKTDSSEPKMNLKETAEAVSSAAAEIKLVTEDLPEKTELVARQINSLITQITMNIALLVLLVFCLSLTFILVKNKMKSPKKQSSRSKGK